MQRWLAVTRRNRVDDSKRRRLRGGIQPGRNWIICTRIHARAAWLATRSDSIWRAPGMYDNARLLISAALRTALKTTSEHAGQRISMPCTKRTQFGYVRSGEQSCAAESHRTAARLIRQPAARNPRTWASGRRTRVGLIVATEKHVRCGADDHAGRTGSDTDRRRWCASAARALMCSA
jgi:hypothetical protein